MGTCTCIKFDHLMHFLAPVNRPGRSKHDPDDVDEISDKYYVRSTEPSRKDDSKNN